MTTVAISTQLHNPSGDIYALRLLRDAGFEIKLISNKRFSQGNASDEEEIDILQGAAAVLAAGERYTKNVIESLPDLRVIARLGVGFDKVDLEAANANNVLLTITPNANHEAVAEHTIALIMSVAKSIVMGDKAVRDGKWPTESLRPIRGSSLGIIGLGRIGQDVAYRALAMKMNVIAAEPHPNMEFILQNNIQLADLDTLLQESDFVSLNCALSNKTRGLIDRKKLALMKPGAILINTARGGLVVEKDLVEALASGHIAGAGLDVFEIEPPGKDNLLYTMNNVVMSPHMAGNDTLSVENMRNEAAQFVIDLFNGNWPDDAIVNKELKNIWTW